MLTLTINGEDRQFDVPEDMPLLWVLRDVAGLTGTKFGCGMALCGACTVHLDGRPVRSCVLPVVARSGRKITTIEAIGEKRGRRRRSSKPGSPGGACSAAIASRGRSCRRRRCWQRTRSRPMPISTWR